MSSSEVSSVSDVAPSSVGNAPQTPGGVEGAAAGKFSLAQSLKDNGWSLVSASAVTVAGLYLLIHGAYLFVELNDETMRDQDENVLPSKDYRRADVIRTLRLAMVILGSLLILFVWLPFIIKGIMMVIQRRKAAAAAPAVAAPPA